MQTTGTGFFAGSGRLLQPPPPLFLAIGSPKTVSHLVFFNFPFKPYLTRP